MAEDLTNSVEGLTSAGAKALRAENAHLKAMVQALQNSRLATTQWILGELSNVLLNFARVANEGNPQAKQALKDFSEALDQARQAAGKITIIRNGN